MLKLIIYFTGNPGIWGPKVRGFLWTPKHKAYVWDGRELEVEEFNRVERKVLTADDIDLYKPSVRVVESPAAVIPLSPAKTFAEERAIWASEVRSLRKAG
jgi:hypothetical protein